ncbi:MAG: hypothetical protein HYT70_03115 [Candidatus Aenigmarchaeota archaeon]|nr:hypothetical protein [Candidatus Aenigmarchaeota archaeon]
MKKAGNTLNLLAAMLFAVACNGQQSPTTAPSPTPYTISQSNPTPTVRMQESSVNDYMSYRMTESDAKTIEAFRYLQRAKQTTLAQATPAMQMTPYAQDLGIYHNSIRVDNDRVRVTVYDETKTYDLAILFFTAQDRSHIERQLKAGNSLQVTKPKSGETRRYPEGVKGRSTINYPVTGYREGETITTIADNDFVVYSQTQVRQPKLSGEEAVAQLYGNDVGVRAVNLFESTELKKDDILSRSLQGNPYTIEELHRIMGTNNPAELSAALDLIYDKTYLFSVEEKEMVEFRDAVDSYREFKKETSFGTKEQANIDPRLKALIVYTAVFGARAVHQDPLTAQRYAFATARDEATREGVFEIVYDLYYYGKSGAESATVRVRESKPEDVKQTLRQKVNETIQQGTKEAGQKTRDAAQDASKEWQKEAERLRQEAERSGSEALKKGAERATDIWQDTTQAAREAIQDFFKKKN